MALSQPRSAYRIDEGPDAKKARVAADADDVSDTAMDVDGLPNDAHSPHNGRAGSMGQRVHRRTSSLIHRIVSCWLSLPG